MPTITAERRFAADPTSAALLLAAPTAVELWPGVRRVDAATSLAADPSPVAPGEDRIQVELVLPAGLVAADSAPAAAVVHARAPRRTPTSFVLRFDFATDALPPTSGRLTLHYADDAGDPDTAASTTRAVLVLEHPPAVPGVRSALTGMATAFLANLADAAEGRSRAA